MEKLTKEAIEQAITSPVIPEIRVFDVLDSTNAECKRLALSDASLPVLITAVCQTAGRGRMGRSFYSPADTGVYFSVLYEAKGSLENAVTVTGAAAVCVMRAVRALTGKQTEIKWVNDLYLEGKKVCGILAECVTAAGETPKLILGIGINLSTEDFPEELTQKAGSLGSDVSHGRLIAAVWDALAPFLADPSDRSWLEDYRACSCVLGRSIAWTEEGKTRFGIAEGINDRGELEVLDESGTRCLLRTGEISVRVKIP